MYLLVVFALVATACGDDGGDDAAEDSVPTTTEAAAPDDGAEAVDATSSSTTQPGPSFEIFYVCVNEEQDETPTAEQRAQCPHDGFFQCAPGSPSPFCPEGYFGWLVAGGGPLPCEPPEGTRKTGGPVEFAGTPEEFCESQ